MKKKESRAEKQPQRMYLTRVFGFSAGHRLYNPELSAEENRRLFGQCTSVHGHNYRLQVTVTGRIQPKTGYAVNFEELDRVLRQEVLVQVDHHDLNADVPGLEGKVVTAETICLWLWDQVRATLEKHLPHVSLSALRLYETDRSYVEYRGE